MSTEDLLTTYWSQLTLFLLGIGYIVKKFFDTIFFKKESNYKLFQQNKIDSLNRFFTNYSKTEQMWTSIAIWDILSYKLSAKKIDEIILPLMNELKSSELELMIYFEDKEHEYFRQIVKNIEAINDKLSEVYFDFDEDKSIIQKSNNFQGFRDIIFSKNTKIFKEIIKTIHLKFN